MSQLQNSSQTPRQSPSPSVQSIAVAGGFRHAAIRALRRSSRAGANPTLSATTISMVYGDIPIAAIYDGVRRFSPQEQRDDMTLIVAKCRNC
jgi:hypothetical protein